MDPIRVPVKPNLGLAKIFSLSRRNHKGKIGRNSLRLNVNQRNRCGATLCRSCRYAFLQCSLLARLFDNSEPATWDVVPIDPKLQGAAQQNA